MPKHRESLAAETGIISASVTGVCSANPRLVKSFSKKFPRAHAKEVSIIFVAFCKLPTSYAFNVQSSLSTGEKKQTGRISSTTQVYS